MEIGDLIVLAVLAACALVTFMAGFVRSVLWLGSWAVAIVATVYGYPLVVPFIQPYVKFPYGAETIAIAGVFLATLLLATLVSHILARSIRSGPLGALDRSVGLLFGVCLGALLISFVYLLADSVIAYEDQPEWVREARSLPLVRSGAGMVKALLSGRPEDIATSANEMQIQLERTTEPTGPVAAPDPSTSGDPAGTSGEGNPESAGPAGNSGYKDAERKDLDRLIQGTQ